MLAASLLMRARAREEYNHVFATEMKQHVVAKFQNDKDFSPNNQGFEEIPT